MSTSLRKTWLLHPWTVAFLAAATGLAGVGYFIWSFSEDFGPCQIVEEQSIASPDGMNRIVVFGRACNATVAFNTQLSISPAAGRFTLETSPPFFVAVNRGPIRAVWLSNDRVEVDLPDEASVRRREPRVGDITIEYK